MRKLIIAVMLLLMLQTEASAGRRYWIITQGGSSQTIVVVQVAPRVYYWTPVRRKRQSYRPIWVTFNQWQRATRWPRRY